VKVTPLTGTIGALIEGVDVATIGDDEWAELHQTLLERRVVFLRDQDLTDDEHLAFAQRWGEVSVYPIVKLLGGDIRLEYIEDDPDKPPAADYWHTDVTWVEEPPKVAVLSGRVIPPAGGDTMWGDAVAVFASLSPAVQDALRPLDLHHRPGPEFAKAVEEKGGADLARQVDEAFGAGVEHPLVRRHPETGEEALFWGGPFIGGIVGLARDESDALLGLLQQRVNDPDHHVRWRWRANDLAIWDERATVHRALADHYPQHRLMRRCTVDGDRPTR
jgi:taurine dioxygenase